MFLTTHPLLSLCSNPICSKLSQLQMDDQMFLKYLHIDPKNRLKESPKKVTFIVCSCGQHTRQKNVIFHTLYLIQREKYVKTQIKENHISTYPFQLPHSLQTTTNKCWCISHWWKLNHLKKFARIMTPNCVKTSPNILLTGLDKRWRRGF